MTLSFLETANHGRSLYADDCIFADEKGRTLNKTALVADITPVPKGYSGTIKIVRPESRIFGDMAVLSVRSGRNRNHFRPESHGAFHEIDTWLRRDGQWQIIASQVHRYYEDPAIGKADLKCFPDFVGIYELVPGRSRTVIMNGDQLAIERDGKREQLFPDSCDIFFRKGVEGRILFRTDANNKADALIDRRNNEDVIWRKQSSVYAGFSIVLNTVAMASNAVAQTAPSVSKRDRNRQS